MTKKVIQVPVDEKLLEELNSVSRKRRKARSELIRRACWDYLRKEKDEELDRLYKEGYRRVPEDAEIGESQVSVAGEILPKEIW